MKDKSDSRVLIVIPARYNSTRLPGKPLVDIHGKSMVHRVYEKCCEAVDDSRVVVATDDDRIKDYCKRNKINVVMTNPTCLTGTDRVAEVAKIRKTDFYINVQGDEPLILASDIEAVIEATLKPGSSVINAMAPITTEEEFFNLNIPKVVFDENKKLLYMSRSSVPISKDGKFVRAHKQVCIYGFKRETLLAVMAANTKTANEAIEDIEILRFLDKGYDVQMVPVSGGSIAVDTEQDLKKVKELIKNWQS